MIPGRTLYRLAVVFCSAACSFFVRRFSLPRSVIEPSYRHRAVFVPFDFHDDFHRLTADRAVFDVLLRRSAARIHIELQRLAAVGTVD